MTTKDFDRQVYEDGYALGKDNAHRELRAGMWADHPGGCGCEPCQTVRAVMDNRDDDYADGYARGYRIGRGAGYAAALEAARTMLEHPDRRRCHPLSPLPEREYTYNQTGNMRPCVRCAALVEALAALEVIRRFAPVDAYATRTQLVEDIRCLDAIDRAGTHIGSRTEDFNA